MTFFKVKQFNSLAVDFKESVMANGKNEKDVEKPDIHNTHTIQYRNAADYFKGSKGKERISRLREFTSSVLGGKRK